METIDCRIGDCLHFGNEVCLQLTGRIEAQLFVFIDALRRHRLEGHDGFHASAPCGARRRAHVLALRDGDTFGIGSIRVCIERVRTTLSGAEVLRDVRLRIEAPTPCVRTTAAQTHVRVGRAIKGATCWS